MKNNKRIIASILTVLLLLLWTSSASAKVMWGKTELKQGQIGKVTILTDAIAVKLADNGYVSPSHILKKSGEFRVYTVRRASGIDYYGLGGGLFVEKTNKIKYETPSKRKLALLEQEKQKDNLVIDLNTQLDSLYVDGVKQSISPEIMNGYAYVSLQSVVAGMREKYSWDELARTATIEKTNGQSIQVTNGKNSILVDNKVKPFLANYQDVKPTMINGVVYVPVQFVRETLGYPITVREDSIIVGKAPSIPTVPSKPSSFDRENILGKLDDYGFIRSYQTLSYNDGRFQTYVDVTQDNNMSVKIQGLVHTTNLPDKNVSLSKAKIALDQIIPSGSDKIFKIVEQTARTGKHPDLTKEFTFDGFYTNVLFEAGGIDVTFSKVLPEPNVKPSLKVFDKESILKQLDDNGFARYAKTGASLNIFHEHATDTSSMLVDLTLDKGTIDEGMYIVVKAWDGAYLVQDNIIPQKLKLALQLIFPTGNKHLYQIAESVAETGTHKGAGKVLKYDGFKVKVELKHERMYIRFAK